MHSNHMGGIVIPFPQAARAPAARQHSQRRVALPPVARNRSAWRDAAHDALALACAIAAASAQAYLLLRAFGAHPF